MEKGTPFFALVTPIDDIIVPPKPGQPGVPTHPIAGVGTPEHPIVIPPDAAGPGLPEHPIWLPAVPDNSLPPTAPIVFPPGLPARPDNTLPLPPTAGLPPLVPSNPIYLPAGPDHTLPKPPEGAEEGVDGVIVLLPPNKMAVPPGVPGDSQAAILWYGPGTLPVQVWLPPATGAEPKHNRKGRKAAEE
jgi:hypothetical protein